MPGVGKDPPSSHVWGNLPPKMFQLALQSPWSVVWGGLVAAKLRVLVEKGPRPSPGCVCVLTGTRRQATSSSLCQQPHVS